MISYAEAELVRAAIDVVHDTRCHKRPSDGAGEPLAVIMGHLSGRLGLYAVSWTLVTGGVEIVSDVRGDPMSLGVCHKHRLPEPARMRTTCRLRLRHEIPTRPVSARAVACEPPPRICESSVTDCAPSPPRAYEIQLPYVRSLPTTRYPESTCSTMYMSPPAQRGPHR